jgi:hypothetical protein
MLYQVRCLKESREGEEEVLGLGILYTSPHGSLIALFNAY